MQTSQQEGAARRRPSSVGLHPRKPGRAQHLREVPGGKGVGARGVRDHAPMLRLGDGGDVRVQDHIEEQVEERGRHRGCEEGGGDHEAFAATPQHRRLQRGLRRHRKDLSGDGAVRRWRALR